MILDARKNFFNLWVVWAVVAIITLIAFVVAFSITKDIPTLFNGESFHKDANRILEYYKVPIAIMALLIPLLASLNSAHRSEQTRVQIETSNNQNLFQNHFKNIEEFEKYIKTHLSFAENIIGTRKTYNLIFPYSKNGNFKLSKNLRIFINEKAVNIIRELSKFNVDTFTCEESQRWLDSVYSFINEIEISVGMRFPDSITLSSLDKKWRYDNMAPFYARSIEIIIVRIKLISEIIDFSDEKTIRPLSQILRINPKNIESAATSNRHPPHKGFNLFEGIEIRGN